MAIRHSKIFGNGCIAASVFSDIEEKWAVYIVVSIAILITLGFGLYLVKDKTKKGA